jgi:hypothetical protein
VNGDGVGSLSSHHYFPLGFKHSELALGPVPYDLAGLDCYALLDSGHRSVTVKPTASKMHRRAAASS